jgi:broad specificity phosphatase PhoE
MGIGPVMKPVSLKTTLYFARHGQTDWNLAGRLQGMRDVPLNDTGRQQARELAGRMEKLGVGGEHLPWLASPLVRAAETAAIIRANLAHDEDDVMFEPRLQELSYGEWEGLTLAETRARDPEATAAREADKWNHIPPGGESYQMLLERVAPVLLACSQPAIVVSHGGILRVALALFGLEEPETACRIDVVQGRVLVISPDGYGWH